VKAIKAKKDKAPTKKAAPRSAKRPDVEAVWTLITQLSPAEWAPFESVSIG
jgi:hypothetical protein